MVKSVSRQSAELAYKKMWLRVTRFNLDKDIKLAQMLGIQNPRSMEWHLHEAILKAHPGLSAYENMNFPPELPPGYFEPIGIDYG